MSARNVLFITLDQWRADCLGAAGTLSPVRTPNLDRLCAEGAIFTRHFAQAAPCGPSRASLLTGTYAMTHRSVLNGTPLDNRFDNLARAARRAGWDPTLFGYTDTSIDPRTVGEDDPRLRTYEGVLPGFAVEVLLDGDLAAWGKWLAERGYDVPSKVAKILEPDPTYPGASDHAPTWAPPRYRAEHSEAAFLTEAVVDWIERREAPWFAHVAFIRPHPPYRAPAPWHDAYDPGDVPTPVRAPSIEAEAEVHPLAAGLLSVPDLTIGTDERALAQLRATYYGMVSEVDDQLGRLLDALDAYSMTDDTLVVVTSDHGEMLGDHWLLEKLGWFDESYHVPLIVRDPTAGAAGVQVDAFTESVDVMPTILEWMGIEIPDQCDGRSLLGFVRDTPPERWRSEVHWEWDFRDPVGHLAEDLYDLTLDQATLAVIRDERGKYVHFAGMPPLYFDLTSDPQQIDNLADDPRTTETVLDYAQRMLSWRMRHADRTLTGTLLTSKGPVRRVDPRV